MICGSLHSCGPHTRREIIGGTSLIYENDDVNFVLYKKVFNRYK